MCCQFITVIPPSMYLIGSSADRTAASLAFDYRQTLAAVFSLKEHANRAGSGQRVRCTLSES
jgi:hypothetical protein